MIVDQPEEEFTLILGMRLLSRNTLSYSDTIMGVLKFYFFYIFHDTEIWVPFFDLQHGIMAPIVFSKWHIPISYTPKVPPEC